MPMVEDKAAVTRHYARPDLAATILTAFHAAGKDPKALTRDDLGPFDELHQRGRAATRELAKLAALPKGARVLDVGCGIGGPGRTLAAEFGLRVEGVDLTEEFVKAAEALTRATRVEPKPSFRVADATDLPFPDGDFDGVFLMHVTMNIRDKAALFREAARVLKPGGVLILYEVCRTPGGGEPHYPTVWASTAGASFLATAEEMRGMAAAAGFEEEDWLDVTERGIQWYRDLKKGTRTPPAVSVEAVLGPDVAVRRDNNRRNLEEGRVSVVQGRFVRA